MKVNNPNLAVTRHDQAAPANLNAPGAHFTLHLTIPPTYPFAPPSVRFTAPTVPIHANIHPHTGEICLDLLKDGWSPAYTLSSTLEAVQRLLGDPNPDSPLNVDVGVLMRLGDMVAVEGLVRWGLREIGGE